MVQPTFTISPSRALSFPSPNRCSRPCINFLFNFSPKSSRIACLSYEIPNRASCHRAIPARDRIIDFGKYKGKMLGSLPSSYLKWVSKNLRAGDMEEWARMADQVLEDPVYGDRIEWEAAEKILSGNRASHYSNMGNGRNAVTELLEVSERFGWDNEDKSGWSKIDFGLLGTSKGGRIPRVTAEAADRRNVEVGNLEEEEEGSGDGGRRRERRERRRWREKRSRVREEEDGRIAPPAVGAAIVEPKSPFPGREAMLNKALNRRPR